MHATPHTNLFGVTTHYGTHPHQPRPLVANGRRFLRGTAVAAVAIALATGRLMKR